MQPHCAHGASMLCGRSCHCAHRPSRPARACDSTPPLCQFCQRRAARCGLCAGHADRGFCSATARRAAACSPSSTPRQGGGVLPRPQGGQHGRRLQPPLRQRRLRALRAQRPLRTSPMPSSLCSRQNAAPLPALLKVGRTVQPLNAGQINDASLPPSCPAIASTSDIRCMHGA